MVKCLVDISQEFWDISQLPGGGGRRKATWLPVDIVTIQIGCLVNSGKHFGYRHAQRTYVYMSCALEYPHKKQNQRNFQALDGGTKTAIRNRASRDLEVYKIACNEAAHGLWGGQMDVV